MAHFDDLTPYEQDMRRRVFELEFNRAVFLERPSVMLGVIPYLDGDKWCALYGVDLQVGVAGFGNTPDSAMAAFDKAWKGGGR